MKEKLVNIMMGVKTSFMLGCENTVVIPKWVAEQLADALIENGVTISTFKVGDTIWVYDFMWGIIPCEVDKPYHCHAGREGGCTYEMNFTELDIGEYVFATKEEAEKYWRTNEVIL